MPCYQRPDGFCFAASLLCEDVTWSEGVCAYNFPINSTVTLYYQVVSLFTLVVPRLLLICGTVRITIVVMRTHGQISAQAHSVADAVAASTSGLVSLTAKTLRSQYIPVMRREFCPEQGMPISTSRTLTCLFELRGYEESAPTSKTIHRWDK